ncbi:MAG: type I-E CRISPR-associated protein Cse1/CasA [Anaerolineales bacterium]
MSKTFNLISEAWIPCRTLEGENVELGIKHTLERSHELQGVDGDTPLVTASLYRLLLTVLHRVFGPSDAKVWKRLWGMEKWEHKPLADYFDTHKEDFDLFSHQRPFYQKDDPRVRQKSVVNIVPHYASGNNATLFDHKTEGDTILLRPGEAARFLITAQNFGLAGLSGLSEKFTDSPAARGIVFIIQGRNLFETLCLNMVRYDPDKGEPIIRGNKGLEDKPAWEMGDPYKPKREYPLGYLDYLSWQNRKLTLVLEGENNDLPVRWIKAAPGLRMARDETLLDPMQHYRRDEKRGLLVLRYQESRALWRDSSALFSVGYSNPNQERYRAPKSLEWLAQLIDDGILDESKLFQITALGMASNQAKIDFYRQETVPLPVIYLQNPELVSVLSDALAKAEEVKSRLWGSIRKMAELVLAPESDQDDGRKPDKKDIQNLINHWRAEDSYWEALEIPFYHLLDELPRDASKGQIEWVDEIRVAVRGAFGRAQTLAGSNTRALKAAIKARAQLESGLAKAIPHLKEEAKV